MSKTILFNADDWGLSESIHEAITSLHHLNAIDAAGIMMGQKLTEKAIGYAKAHPGFRTGVHLFGNDPDCKPLTRARWPDHWPKLLAIHVGLPLPQVRELVLAEVHAQLQAYKDTGLPLHFVNSHMHFHVHPAIDDAVVDAIRTVFPDFKGWMRLGESRFFPGRVPARLMKILESGIDLFQIPLMHSKWTGLSNDTLWGHDRTFSNNAEEINRIARNLGAGFHEFFLHPGRSSKLTSEGSDRAALLRLATLFPQAERNISRLP